MSQSLKSYQFRKEREASWRRLATLVAKVEKKGLRSLSAQEAFLLPSLYRGAISSLSVARAISLDRNVLDYLEGLVGRAYICVYATKRSPLQALADFVLRDFPGAVRRHWRSIALAYAIMILGVVCGWALTITDIERYYMFVDSGMSQGRDPTATDEQLREPLYADGGGTLEELQLFATFLFTHNSQVGIFSFALGIVVGVPSAILMFYNGLVLGAMGALYQDRGMGVEFWLWVLPHGVTELTAIAFCGGAGFILARAILFPGRRTRMAELGRAGRDAGVVVLGSVAMLFIAALFEGFFRQLVHSPVARALVAATALFFWIGYFGFVGLGRGTRR